MIAPSKSLMSLRVLVFPSELDQLSLALFSQHGTVYLCGISVLSGAAFSPSHVGMAVRLLCANDRRTIFMFWTVFMFWRTVCRIHVSSCFIRERNYRFEPHDTSLVPESHLDRNSTKKWEIAYVIPSYAWRLCDLLFIHDGNLLWTFAFVFSLKSSKIRDSHPCKNPAWLRRKRRWKKRHLWCCWITQSCLQIWDAHFHHMANSAKRFRTLKVDWRIYSERVILLFLRCSLFFGFWNMVRNIMTRRKIFVWEILRLVSSNIISCEKFQKRYDCLLSFWSSSCCTLSWKEWVDIENWIRRLLYLQPECTSTNWVCSLFSVWGEGRIRLWNPGS